VNPGPTRVKGQVKERRHGEAHPKAHLCIIILLSHVPAQAEAKQQSFKLVRQSFGETMLHAIGFMYEQQADLALSGFFGGIAARVKAAKESVK
jgi:hypothetical protein